MNDVIGSGLCGLGGVREGLGCVGDWLDAIVVGLDGVTLIRLAQVADSHEYKKKYYYKI